MVAFLICLGPLSAKAFPQELPDSPPKCSIPFGKGFTATFPPMWAKVFRAPGLEFTRSAPTPAEVFSWQPAAGVDVSLRRVAPSAEDTNQIRVWVRTARGSLYRLRQTDGGSELGDSGEDIVSEQVESRDDPTVEVCWIKASGAEGLVLLRYQSEGTGASTVWNSTTEILIAVDQRTPRVLGVLRWAWNEGGGACGVWSNGAHQAAECEWDETERDYVCTESELMFNAHWTHHQAGNDARTFSRRFWLRSGRPVVDSRAISTEALWNTLMAASPPTVNKEYLLMGVGAVRYVTHIQTPTGPAFVVAAEGRTSSLDARFLLVRKRRDGRFIRDAIPAFQVSTTNPTEAPRGDLPAEYQSVTSAKITVGAVSKQGAAFVWPVAVSRAGHSSLYLLGAEVVGDRVLAGSFFLSTDALVQEDCADLVLPDATVEARPAGPLAFNLLVQVGHVVSGVAAEVPREFSPEGDSVFETHAWLRVGWATGRGFVYSTPHAPDPRVRIPRMMPAPVADFLTRPRGWAHVRAGKESLAVDVLGRGRPVVFVWPGTGPWPQPFLDSAREMGAILPDDPGAPDWNIPMELRVAMETLASEFRVISMKTDGGEHAPKSTESLLNAFEIFALKGVTVIAVGEARAMATEFARAYPNRVRILGLLGPPSTSDASPSKRRVRTLGPDIVDEVRKLATPTSRTPPR